MVTVNHKAFLPLRAWSVDIVTVWGGGEPRWLSAEEAEIWNRDPDEGASKQLGFASKAEYYEWLQNCGAPRCGALTKRGTLCKNWIGGHQLSPKEWLGRDRSEYCYSHGGAER